MGSSQRKLALLCGAAAVLWSAQAAAQTVSTPTNDAAKKVTAPAQAPSEEAGQGSPPTDNASASEVVVTATRRSETVQNVPQTVTAVTAADLTRINAHTLGDFASFVPGLTTISGGSTSQIVIRGVTTGFQLSSSVGLYLDDVPLGASTSFGLGATSFNVNAYDLNRVEVLNGPQGTLFGSNSLGGTVRYITAAPDPRKFTAEGEAEVSSTAHGGINDGFRLNTNIPLPNEYGALRLDVINEYTSGYIDDPVYHRQDQGSFHSFGYRASLLLKPTEDIDVRLTGYSQRVPGEGLADEFRSPVTGRPTVGDYQQAFPVSQPTESGVDLGSAAVDWNLHGAKLSAIVAYQVDHGFDDTDESLVYDPLLGAFGAGTDPFRLFVNTYTKKFTQELRLASDDSNPYFSWIGGFFHDFERTTEVVNLYDDKNPGGTLFNLPVFLDRLPSTYNENAIYADGTIKFTRRLTLGLGIRYSHQDQVYYDVSSGLLATGSALARTRPKVTSGQDVETYLINPKFQITDNSQVYVRIASGFRPGGPNFVVVQGLSNATFNPDKLWNYELGEKTTFLNRRATLDLDVYDIEWSDIEQVINVGGVNQIINAGDARVRGVEGAFSYKVTPQLSLTGSGSYTDAYLTTAAPTVGVTRSGARLPIAPKYNFALLGTYTFKVTDAYSGALTVADRYIGERNAGFGTTVSPNFRLQPYNTVDLDLALYGPRGVELDIFARNVTDVRGEIGAATAANEYNPLSPVPVLIAQPRTVGATIRVRFN